ncbi:MAG TPA: hypothetical protein VKZ67_07045 [Natronosporangium sp.]|nr:hypothetical protein [Natronosporangium sp.]
MKHRYFRGGFIEQRRVQGRALFGQNAPDSVFITLGSMGVVGVHSPSSGR